MGCSAARGDGTPHAGQWDPLAEHSTSGSTQIPSFLPAVSGSVPSSLWCPYPGGSRGVKGCGEQADTPCLCAWRWARQKQELSWMGAQRDVR